MHLKSLISNGKYSIGYLSSSVVFFVLTVLMTHSMSTEDFGKYSLFYAAVFTLWPFIGVSTHFYIQSLASSESGDFGGSILPALLLNFSLCACVTLLFVINYEFIQQLLGLERHWIAVIPLVSFGWCVHRIGLVIFQARGKYTEFAILIYVQVSLNAVLTCYLVFFQNLGWEGRAISVSLTSLFTTFLTLSLLARNYSQTLDFSVTKFKVIFLFGVSAFSVDLCIVLLGFSDKVFINYLLSADQLGIYAFGMQLATVIGVLDSAVVQTLYPHLYRYIANDQKKLAKTVVTAYFLSLTLFSLLYAFLLPIMLKKYVGSDFENSFAIMQVSIPALILFSIYKICMVRVYYMKAAHHLLLPSIFIILITLASHYVLINKYFLDGAVVANFVAYLMLAFFTYRLSRKLAK